MTLGQTQELFSRDVVKLLLRAYALGYEVRLGEAERPQMMQDYYFSVGKSKTRTGQHTKKLAIDLHFFKAGQICYPPELGKFWEELSPQNRWGGNFDRDWTKEDNFKDGPHFERRE